MQVLAFLALIGTLIRGADLVHWCTCQESRDRQLELAGLCDGAVIGDRVAADGIAPVVDQARCTHEVADDHLRRGGRVAVPPLMAGERPDRRLLTPPWHVATGRPAMIGASPTGAAGTPWVRRL